MLLATLLTGVGAVPAHAGDAFPTPTAVDEDFSCIDVPSDGDKQVTVSPADVAGQVDDGLDDEGAAEVPAAEGPPAATSSSFTAPCKAERASREHRHKPDAVPITEEDQSLRCCATDGLWTHVKSGCHEWE